MEVNVPPGILSFRSCSKGEVSYEGVKPELAKLHGLQLQDNGVPEEFQHGIFTKALVDGLNTKNPVADSNHDGQVTLFELTEYVILHVQQYAKDYHGGEQNPIIDVSEGEKFDDFALLTELPIYGFPTSVWRNGQDYLRKARNAKKDGEYKEAYNLAKKASEVLLNRQECVDEEKECLRLWNEQRAKEYFDQARRAVEDRNLNLALTMINEAIKILPDNDEYNTERIKIDDSQKKAKKAFDGAQNAFKNGEYAKALKLINGALDLNIDFEYTSLKERIVKIAPEKASEAYSRALQHYNSGQYKDAYNSINDALVLAPSNGEYIKLKIDIEKKCPDETIEHDISGGQDEMEDVDVEEESAFVSGKGNEQKNNKTSVVVKPTDVTPPESDAMSNLLAVLCLAFVGVIVVWLVSMIFSWVKSKF